MVGPYYEYGEEVIFSKAKGHSNSRDPSHHKKIVEELDGLTLRGRYMAVKLERFLINVMFQSKYDETRRPFCLLQAVLENIWDSRIRITPIDDLVKMIDSEGFQHSPDWNRYEFCHLLLPGSKTIVEAKFASPEDPLEAHAKTRGWIGFGALPKDIVPHRFIFRFRLFEPGAISGSVQAYETLEFILLNHSVIPVKQLPVCE